VGVRQNKPNCRPFVGKKLFLLPRAIEPVPQVIDHLGGNGVTPEK
jgi:hypothetical protein